MDKIYILGDQDTVSAFRLAGVEGVVSDPLHARTALEDILAKEDAGIVLVTQALARPLESRIAELNLNRPNLVLIEIPGLDDTEGFRRSAMGYVAEALGITL
jgi:vacuolar-type H+-ATPase subunit F/Vma7